MSKFLTQEEIEKEIKKRGYILMDKYINSSTKMTLKDKEGYLYSITWNSFQQKSEPKPFHKSNPYTIQNIQNYLDLNMKGYKLLSIEYKGITNKLKFKCNKGHIFTSTWDSISHGQRCSVCAGKQVTLETCIATTDSWMEKYFVNKEDAYTHSYGSNDVVEVKCIDCGKEKKMKINNLYKYKSIACTCGDGISYPNKFVYIAMTQAFGVNNVFTEQKFVWSDNKIYDILVKTQNGDILIENHGRQHYKNTNRGRTLRTEQQNDQYKKQLAEQNDFIYIELDCSESSLEWIKQSILNSELSKITDNLYNIDWIKCEEFALSNKVKKVCDYWHLHNEVNNENLTTTDVSKIFNLNCSTIQEYLRKGTKLKWCSYSPKKEIKKIGVKNGKANGKQVEVFKDGKSLGVFESCHELERKSEKLFGVKLNNSNIASVCRGERPHHKGYTFKYFSKIN